MPRFRQRPWENTVDEQVLAAQRWVNATYAGVTGFNPAPEDGVTGWSTMYALTRALQHELGIAALSDTFGPGTLGALQARGGILVADPNANLITLLQCACYGKGYDPGGLTGVFTTATGSAVSTMTAEAGLDGAITDAVPPKVVKALLTMDACRLLPGGTPAIRDVQRWLNRRYLVRTNFFLVACDGILTRDIQKAFYIAVQYEDGMTDAQADGAFGPMSRAALKPHTLAEGDTGPYVNLFTAAMIFNQIRLPGGETYAGFADTFTADVTAVVRVFQAFSELPVTGAGDYATWCQLLVSNGDADRPGTALDCITTITDARAQTLLAAGYRVVGRYLDEHAGGTLNKRIQPGELDTIFRNGLRIFPISEYSAGSASYFTYAQGYQDALDAHTAAAGYGFNLNTVIYFAVDYDATQADVRDHIIPYFTGVAGALGTQGKRYVPGIYGSRNVCARVAAAAYTRWSFIAGMSYGWSGNMGFPLPDNWAFNQIQGRTLGAGAGLIAIDKNVWRSGSDPAVAGVNDPAATVDDLVAHVDQLRQLATGYGGGHAADRLVLQYLRHETHRDDQWRTLLGPIDAGFVAAVDAAGIAPVRQIRDPGTGLDLHVSRIAAAADGGYGRRRPPERVACRGDVAGWGGDWLSFYGEWRRDVGAYPSAAAYCQEKLAQAGTVGTFTRRDLVEDADGYALACHLRAGGRITDAVRAHYLSGGHLRRFTRFLTRRFGTAGNAAAVARSVLLTSDEAVTAARTWFIHTTGGPTATMPDALATADLDELCQAFARALRQASAQEATATTSPIRH
jgi:peptidoglycan hydrolase-like protein with peptidoglycan-binding domain